MLRNTPCGKWISTPPSLRETDMGDGKLGLAMSFRGMMLLLAVGSNASSAASTRFKMASVLLSRRVMTG